MKSEKEEKKGEKKKKALLKETIAENVDSMSTTGCMLLVTS